MPPVIVTDAKRPKYILFVGNKFVNRVLKIYPALLKLFCLLRPFTPLCRHKQRSVFVTFGGARCGLKAISCAPTIILHARLKTRCDANTCRHKKSATAVTLFYAQSKPSSSFFISATRSSESPSLLSRSCSMRRIRSPSSGCTIGCSACCSSVSTGCSSTSSVGCS